ncbi:hypothetical protein [Desulfonatronospira sp.]|uniref:hypothetical protein n=1 Tax=Desulfonatronospira sp. TaxID=1962951 RepID=UPI0025C39E06|nr:hypothetical protein [Desulfonatronospira sp.]
MPKIVLFFLIFLLAFSTQVWAGHGPKKYAVMPIEIYGPQEYAYLKQGIQSMLSSRLTRTGQTSPIPPGEVNQLVDTPPATEDEALMIAAQLDADFLVYGVANIVNNICNLEIYVVGPDMERQRLDRESSLGQLIPDLEDLAQELTAMVIKGVEDQDDLEDLTPVGPVAEAPPEDEAYISPHFQFQDDPQATGRWRSQTLPFSSVGVAVGDTQGSGEKNIFILSQRRLHAYRMHEKRLQHISTYEAPGTYQNLNINLLDINNNGEKEIIVSAIQDKRARSYILGFKNNEFQEMHLRITFFMNVVKVPPQYKHTLVGQPLSSGTRLFRPGGVQEVMMTSNGPELGRGITLPDKANIFNFAFLPRNDDHLVVVADNDRLEVYSNNNRRYTTSEEYAGSGLGIETDERMPGMGQPSPREREVSYYYIPTRLITARFEGQDEYHLLAHKHFSGRLASVFQRYRNFPEGEIHALFWDEIGLNLHWNTRRIKASIEDFGLYDIDGDGRKELVVCVNTHPGITGMQEQRTILLAYKMEF